MKSLRFGEAPPETPSGAPRYQQENPARSSPAGAELYVVYLLTDPERVNPGVVSNVAALTGIPDADQILAKP